MPFMSLSRLCSRRTASAIMLAGVLTAACADADDYASAELASELARSPNTLSTPVTAPAPAAEEKEPREWLYIHGTLNVRAEPDKNASIVRTLRRGDMVQLGPGNANGWARIYTGAVEDEYVYRASDLVRTSSPPPAEPVMPVVAAPERATPRPSAASNGYHLGPRGGCYTYTRSGNKRYVDRSYCH
jgi:hypothetical protein